MTPPLPIASEAQGLRDAISAARRRGQSIGFVPTMGALHEGHASLIRAARAEVDCVVASIFVNPLQFGPKEDLGRYPRPFADDCALLQREGCDLLFAPDPAAMYPAGFATRVEMNGLTDVLCGAARPGHFSGVLTVVMKLLQLVQPDRAYFGKKDYQQALVIRRMVMDLDVPVAIVTCPIIREPDGLAMSSRNRYLSAEERADAIGLRRALLAMDQAFRAGRTAAQELLSLGRVELARYPRLREDYLEIRDPLSLALRTEDARPGDLVAIAMHCGPARLIDNATLGEEVAP